MFFQCIRGLFRSLCFFALIVLVHADSKISDRELAFWLYALCCVGAFVGWVDIDA